MSRALFACLVVLGALALLAPASALAGGPPSAGNSQYIDPLTGSGQSSSSHSNSSHASTSPATTPSTPSSSSSGSTSTTPSTTSTTPSTTGSTASTGKSKDPSSKTLPHTGFNVPLAVLAGVLLLASGAALRRRIA